MTVDFSRRNLIKLIENLETCTNDLIERGILLPIKISLFISERTFVRFLLEVESHRIRWTEGRAFL